MVLADENASVMDGLGESKFEDLGLKTSLQEIFNAKTENVIELHTILSQNSDTDKTTEKGISFEETLGVLGFESEKLTSSLTDLGQSVLDAPYFSLVLETELSDQFQFL